MSCDLTQWESAANAYNEAMVDVNAKCVAEAQAEDNVATAEQALATAQSELAAAQAAHATSKSNAAVAQTNMAAEAEKLGVQCECPTEPTPAAGATVFK